MSLYSGYSEQAVHLDISAKIQAEFMSDDKSSLLSRIISLLKDVPAHEKAVAARALKGIHAYWAQARWRGFTAEQWNSIREQAQLPAA